MKKSEKTRALICEVAAQIIDKEGIEGLTLRNLVKHSKMSIGGVLYHFPKMEDVFFAVIEHIYQDESFYLSSRDQQLEGKKYLLRFAELNLKYFRKKPHYYSCILLSYHSARRQSEFRKFHRKVLQQTLEILCQKVQASLNNISREKTDEEILEFCWSYIYRIEGYLIFNNISADFKYQQFIDSLNGHICQFFE